MKDKVISGEIQTGAFHKMPTTCTITAEPDISFNQHMHI